MIRRELALKLAAMGSVRRWDPHVQCVYDDSRRLRVPYITERVRRYDAALLFRYNAMAERWELLRWRGARAPSLSEMRTIPDEEKARRLMFLWTVQDGDGGYQEPDARTLRKIQLGDLFSRFGSSSAKAIADAMDDQDRKNDAREKLDRDEMYAEQARVIAFQLRKMTGHHKVFSSSR